MLRLKYISNKIHCLTPCTFCFYYHGIVFDSVIALLQILELQLSDEVLSDTGTLCSDGIQQGVVAEHFLIQQLEQQRGGVTLSINCAFYMNLSK